MSDLLIRNVSLAVKSDIQKLAEERGLSLAATAREALRAGIEVMARQEAVADTQPAGDRLREILGGTFETDEEFEEFQKALEEIRHGPSRPLPDFK